MKKETPEMINVPLTRKEFLKLPMEIRRRTLAQEAEELVFHKITPNQWIVGRDTGTSSKTIWAVMMHAVIDELNHTYIYMYDVPQDPDDFRRCVKLITLFPEWRSRLPEVSKMFPAWVGIIREWDKLEAMLPQWEAACVEYQIERQKHPRKAKFNNGMYDFMQRLIDEGKIADGWIQTSPGSWHRENQSEIKERQ